MNRVTVQKNLQVVKDDMLINPSKYSAMHSDLDSIAQMLIEHKLSKQRLNKMETNMVQNVLGEQLEFKAKLEELIRLYDIKIDTEAFEKKQNRFERRNTKQTEIERNKRNLKRI